MHKGQKNAHKNVFVIAQRWTKYRIAIYILALLTIIPATYFTEGTWLAEYTMNFSMFRWHGSDGDIFTWLGWFFLLGAFRPRYLRVPITSGVQQTFKVRVFDHTSVAGEFGKSTIECVTRDAKSDNDNFDTSTKI